jgi:hypothetical protein
MSTTRGNYHLMIYHDGVWERVTDEDGLRHRVTEYKGYGVVNPDGVHIGPQYMGFDEALEFCQRLRRAAGHGDQEKFNRE